MAQLAMRIGRAYRRNQQRDSLRGSRINAFLSFKLVQWNLFASKIPLPILTLPHEPLLRGKIPETRYFLTKTQKYNVYCFHITSFGVDLLEKHALRPYFFHIGSIEGSDFEYYFC